MNPMRAHLDLLMSAMVSYVSLHETWDATPTMSKKAVVLYNHISALMNIHQDSSTYMAVMELR